MNNLSKLIKGVNDLATVNPELAKQWHPTKNENLNPSEVAFNSSRRVWWICEKGHEWEVRIVDRFSNNGLISKCPYCSNKKVLKGFNDLATNRPDIAKQWHPSKNGALLPSNVITGSGKKVWWICEKGHEWEARILDRTRLDGKETGCPYCSGQKILVGFNDLCSTHPELAKEWHPTKNEPLKANNISFGSTKKIWWKCLLCGHEWQAAVYSRTGGRGCPVCSLKIQGRSYIEKLIDTNGSLYDNNPFLSSEWHPTKNGTKTPQMFTVSSQEKVWWKCSVCGYEWQAKIGSRTLGNGCPKCKKDFQTSFPEQALFFYVSKYYPDTINKDRNALNGMELDIYIPSLKIAVEYDGYRWHKGKQSFTHENEKNKECIENGIKLIRIREAGLDKHDDCICILRKNKNDKDLERSIIMLLSIIGINDVKINIQRDRIKIYELSIAYRKENNLSNTNDKLKLEWNYEKNGLLKPDMVTSKSGRKVWWKCSVCGYEWESTINHRANGHGCPKCYNMATSKRLQKKVRNVETSEVFDSISKASIKYGISVSTLSTALHNKRRTAGGYHWIFIDDN